MDGPMTTRDAVQAAYDAVLGLIASGVQRPGTWLREQALAESLGMSRTPVRQALGRLAAEGVVDIHPRRGAEVLEWSEEEMHGVSVVRAQVEPLAAALAAEAGNPERLESLTALHHQMCALATSRNGVEQIARLNAEFHLEIARLSGNRHLLHVVRLGLRPVMIARTLQQYRPAALARSMNHHAELIEALLANDPDWAAGVMRSHIYAARHAAHEQG